MNQGMCRQCVGVLLVGKCHRLPLVTISKSSRTPCSAFTGWNVGFPDMHIGCSGMGFVALVFCGAALPDPDRSHDMCMCPGPLCGRVSCPSRIPEGAVVQNPCVYLAAF